MISIGIDSFLYVNTGGKQGKKSSIVCLQRLMIKWLFINVNDNWSRKLLKISIPSLAIICFGFMAAQASMVLKRTRMMDEGWVPIQKKGILLFSTRLLPILLSTQRAGECQNVGTLTLRTNTLHSSLVLSISIVPSCKFKSSRKCPAFQQVCPCIICSCEKKFYNEESPDPLQWHNQNSAVNKKKTGV